MNSAPILTPLRLSVLAAALASAMPLGVAVAAPQKVQSTAVQIDAAKLASLPAFVDGVLAQQIAQREVGGAIVTVVYGGKVLFTRGYGLADAERGIKVDPLRTMFRPGSVSKLFTWTALMQQIEAGKVDLDADVNLYLDYKIPEQGYKPIKVRDLFSHAPGFGDQSNITVDDVSELMPYGEWLKKHIAMRVREPGGEISYSNYGAALAGYIVERVSGEPFADYAEKHIFRPLGMVDTTFREPLDAAHAPRMAKGYKLENGRLVAKPFELYSNIMPAGSATTTAPDMTRFILMMLNGGTLGNAHILKPQSAHFLESDGLHNSPDLQGFAHGYMVLRQAGPRIVGHGGNTSDFHSELAIAPEAQFGFFVSYTGGPGSYPARTELINAMIGRVFPQAPAPRWTGRRELPPLGAYRSNRRDYSKPAQPKYDLKVSAQGDHGILIEQMGQKTYWEQTGPRIYEQVTGARVGGPYDRIEFYGPANDPRMSYGSEPHVLYRLVPPSE
jgi:CubicO group peptidase (beta-lactamase class C family)